MFCDSNKLLKFCLLVLTQVAYIRPRLTLFCRVSDPTEQAFAIKCAQHCHCCSVGFDTPAGLSFQGSDYPPQDLCSGGLIPCRILFFWVSDSAGKLRPCRISEEKALRVCQSLLFAITVEGGPRK
jgi:hypothetical protein